MLEVGRIVKPHGLGGEVIVDLITDRTERLEPGSTLHTARGDLTVAAARPHLNRWIVTFEGVVDREGAERLRATVLEAEPLDDPDALWVHELIGAPVVLADGATVGTVEEVRAGAGGDLLVLDTGALVPVRFAIGWDDARRVVIDPPPGLLDLVE